MKHIHISKLSLSNYRNFSNINLDFIPHVNIIVGSNGSGKTNILESISYLSPGRGLKNSKFEDVCNIEKQEFKTEFEVNSKIGIAKLETNYIKSKNSRKVIYNGSKIASSELSSLLNVIWLTPQMNGLFLDSASARRKFFDRMVYSFDNSHAKNVVKYDHYVTERNKILSDPIWRSQGEWLSTIESKITQEASKVFSSRQKVLQYMQDAIDNLSTHFTKANLGLSILCDSISDNEFNESEYINILFNNREKDAAAGRTTFGVHKTDLIVYHKEKSQLAKICSTGEQKALLISIILAMIESIMKNTEYLPVLLLDELFVHLDDERCSQLTQYILETKLQTFITTTDIIHLEKLAKEAKIIKL